MGVGIEVHGLNAWYGKNQSLNSIDMSVAANHVTAVIGPSGCGKSTFVRCLNRMHETIPEARAEGSVKVGDMDVYGGGSDPVEVRRRIGMVFQTESIPHHVHLRQRGSGFEAERFPQPEADGRTGGAFAETGCVVGGSKRQSAQEVRGQPFRRTTAAAVHRPLARGRAGGVADGRAGIGA